MPVLSDTDSSARRTRTSPGCVIAAIEPRTIPVDDSAIDARAAGWRGRSGRRRGRSARTASEQQLVLERPQRVADLVGVGRRPGSSIARWRMIGPVSTPSSTKWTVTPNTFTP